MNSEQEPLSETERHWNQILPHLRHDSDRRHGCGVYHFRTGRRTPIGPKLGIEDGFYPNFCSDAKNAPKSTEDTKYKQRFFSVLEKAFNVGKMTEEPIRPIENPLLVFISSMQDEELCRARTLAIDTVDKYPGMRVWAFEDAPASSEAARDRYIRNAGSADLVVWLVGSKTSAPVVEEIDACLAAGGKPLPFLLPVQLWDSQTQELIERVEKVVTWRKVEDTERLPEHIHKALTDEIVRRFRDPVPWNHDLFLKQKHRESITETKRLWTILGVPDGIAGELADDNSIGNKVPFPTSGTLTVTAQQGSGKTLAAHRLYQQALVNRLQNHFQPFPIFLNARNISGDLKDQIEGYTREHGTVYTQMVLVIIDGLDEAGHHKANQLVNQTQSYTDANQNVAAVLMTRLRWTQKFGQVAK